MMGLAWHTLPNGDDRSTDGRFTVRRDADDDRSSYELHDRVTGDVGSMYSTPDEAMACAQAVADGRKKSVAH